MLLVKTCLGISMINGIGLFANQDIPKGTPVWRFMEEFDRSFTLEFLGTLSKEAREQVLHYAYFEKRTGEYVLCADDARFFNHSNEANCVDFFPQDDPVGISIAARDIKKGEELTCDYRTFDGEHALKLGGTTT